MAEENRCPKCGIELPSNAEKKEQGRERRLTTLE